MALTVDRKVEALRQALGKNAKGRAAAEKLRKHAVIERWVAKRQFEKYVKAGGAPGDWQSFLDWLIKNLPTIIAIITALFV